MQLPSGKTGVCLTLVAIALTAQTKPAFEAATVKPSEPLDVVKMRALVQAGGKIPIGPKIDAARAEYTRMDLKSLIALAYGLRTDQIAGPAWMESTSFDIVAKLPDGASKGDAPKMLQSLLEERFKLAVYRTSAEHTVLALVVGKGGLKMKPSAHAAEVFDDNATPNPSETSMDFAPGMRMIMNSATQIPVAIDMGTNGRISMKMDLAAKSMHQDLSAVTMAGLAAWLTERSTNNDGPQVLDMTGLKGNYDGVLDDEMGPDGGSSRMADEMQQLGLKMESRKAMVEQLVIDHVEKTPTGN